MTAAADLLARRERTTKSRAADPDETEGRRLYRGRADVLARAQVSLARHKVTIAAQTKEAANPKAGGS